MLLLAHMLTHSRAGYVERPHRPVSDLARRPAAGQAVGHVDAIAGARTVAIAAYYGGGIRRPAARTNQHPQSLPASGFRVDWRSRSTATRRECAHARPGTGRRRWRRHARYARHARHRASCASRPATTCHGLGSAAAATAAAATAAAAAAATVDARGAVPAAASWLGGEDRPALGKAILRRLAFAHHHLGTCKRGCHPFPLAVRQCG